MIDLLQLERNALSIFVDMSDRIKEHSVQCFTISCLLLIDALLGLLFNPEDGDNISLRNIGQFSKENTVL
jgi:hypothetical protein